LDDELPIQVLKFSSQRRYCTLTLHTVVFILFVVDFVVGFTSSATSGCGKLSLAWWFGAVYMMGATGDLVGLTALAAVVLSTSDQTLALPVTPGCTWESSIATETRTRRNEFEKDVKKHRSDEEMGSQQN
jgi:hypothetical protein